MSMRRRTSQPMIDGALAEAKDLLFGTKPGDQSGTNYFSKSSRFRFQLTLAFSSSTHE